MKCNTIFALHGINVQFMSVKLTVNTLTCIILLHKLAAMFNFPKLNIAAKLLHRLFSEALVEGGLPVAKPETSWWTSK